MRCKLSRQISAEKMLALDKGSRRARLRCIKATGAKGGSTMAGLVSTNTFWSLWLFVHLILAVGLLGALTHQAMAVALPVRPPAGGIVTRFRAVPAAR